MSLLDKPSSAGPGYSVGGLAALRRRLGPAFRALRHRNYRLFFAGQGMSLVGTWMQRTTLALLIVTMYKDDRAQAAMMLGIVGFVGQIMTFLLAPVGGLVAEHAERRKLLVVTQALAMIQAIALAALVFRGEITPLLVILLSGLLGVINAFDIPIRQSFVVELLDSREDLPNAIAMNSFMVNAARLVGPSLAGVLIASAGFAVCFAINAVTFIAVIAALLAMRIKPAPRTPRNTGILRNLHEGLSYAAHFAPIRSVLLLLATISLIGSANGVVVPIIATYVFAGGSETAGSVIYGFMMAASGIGAMAGAIFLAARPSIRGMGRIMVVACCMLGLACIAFGLSGNLILSYCMLALAGMGMMVQFAGSNSLLQTLVDDDKRGRVMSLYVMAFMGMGPFGSLLAGWVVGRIGAPMTIVAGGSCIILAALLFATRLPKLGRAAHTVYLRMGIVDDASDIARL